MECNKLFSETLAELELKVKMMQNKLVIPQGLLTPSRDARSYRNLKHPFTYNSKGDRLIGISKEDNNILVGRDKSGNQFSINYNKLNNFDKIMINNHL